MKKNNYYCPKCKSNKLTAATGLFKFMCLDCGYHLNWQMCRKQENASRNRKILSFALLVLLCAAALYFLTGCAKTNTTTTTYGSSGEITKTVEKLTEKTAINADRMSALSGLLELYKSDKRDEKKARQDRMNQQEKTLISAGSGATDDDGHIGAVGTMDGSSQVAIASVHAMENSMYHFTVANKKDPLEGVLKELATKDVPQPSQWAQVVSKAMPWLFGIATTGSNALIATEAIRHAAPSISAWLSGGSALATGGPAAGSKPTTITETTEIAAPAPAPAITE